MKHNPAGKRVLITRSRQQTILTKKQQRCNKETGKAKEQTNLEDRTQKQKRRRKWGREKHTNNPTTRSQRRKLE